MHSNFQKRAKPRCPIVSSSLSRIEQILLMLPILALSKTLMEIGFFKHFSFSKFFPPYRSSIIVSNFSLSRKNFLGQFWSSNVFPLTMENINFHDNLAILNVIKTRINLYFIPLSLTIPLNH